MNEQQLLNGLTVLTRLAQREPEKQEWLVRVLTDGSDVVIRHGLTVAIETGEPMIAALQSVLAAKDIGSDLRLSLFQQIPSYTVRLLPLVLALDQQLIEDVNRHGSRIPDSLGGKVLADFAERLIEAGRESEAVPFAKAAVERLGDAADLSALLNALRVLALSQRRNGNTQEAIATAQEAVQLAERHSATLEGDAVASALVALANSFEEADRFEDCVETATRSIELWRQLQAALPAPLEHALSRTLPGQKVHVFLGSREQLPPSGQFVRFTTEGQPEAIDPRNFVIVDPRQPSPDAVRFGLALALHSRAGGLAGTGRHEQAIIDEQEAVPILRDHRDSDPDAFSTHLGVALGRMSTSLMKLERTDEALVYAKEAIHSLRVPVTATPTSHIWGVLANLQGKLFNAFADRGMLAEATGMAANLVVLTAARYPNGGPLWQALGNDLARIGDQLHGSVDFWYLLTVCRRRTQHEHEEGFNQLCHALFGYANALHAAGDLEKALLVAREAVELTSSPRSGSVDTESHVLALFGLARRLSGSGNVSEAYDMQRDALQLWVAGPVSRPRPALLTVVGVSNYVAFADKAKRKAVLPVEVHRELATAFMTLGNADDRTLDMCAQAAQALVVERAQAGDPVETRALHDALVQLAKRHPANRRLFVARVVVGWPVVMCHVDADHVDWANQVYEDLEGLARATSDPAVVIEHAKCATELIAKYQSLDDLVSTRVVIRRAWSSLRSSDYLEVRKRDLGQDPDEFLAALDAILAAETSQA